MGSQASSKREDLSIDYFPFPFPADSKNGSPAVLLRLSSLFAVRILLAYGGFLAPELL